jgi:hypothetical protein
MLHYSYKVTYFRKYYFIGYNVTNGYYEGKHSTLFI